jgi:exodeoxyribonuclease-1
MEDMTENTMHHQETNQPTIYWHDYETWGANPQKDLPCQFAGVRTDLDLNIIGEPLMIYARIASDCLPNPQACMVTGITPQITLREGLLERDFIAKIYEQFSQANTCVSGYNNIRFDDEVTRYALYRNFYDPYAREWQNGNSRWDIIDLARACYALRPEGINWPVDGDGRPSFRLQALTEANGIAHQDAHDAMSDVYATIALAKLIKQAQPKLYDFVFNLRSKHKVAELINYDKLLPLMHISAKLPAQQGCCSWVVPIAPHPENKNALIVLNLALDPGPLLDLNIEQLKEKLYTTNAQLAKDEQRLPIKLVHLNKCPILAPAKTLTAENAQRLGIDRQQCLIHLQHIKDNPLIKEKLLAIYQSAEDRATLDPDYALYSGGFVSKGDKALMQQVVTADKDSLTELHLPFEDERLITLLFRYRARNFPEYLTEDERHKWQRFREFKLADPSSEASIKMPEYLLQIEQLSIENARNPQKLGVLSYLYKYAKAL